MMRRGIIIEIPEETFTNDGEVDTDKTIGQVMEESFKTVLLKSSVLLKGISFSFEKRSLQILISYYKLPIVCLGYPYPSFSLRDIIKEFPFLFKYQNENKQYRQLEENPQKQKLILDSLVY